MAKKFNFDTIKGMRTDAILKALMWMVFSLVLIIVGGTIASKGGAFFIVAGLIIAVLGGGWTGSKAYDIVVDPKNQKTCNANFWNKYTCISNPSDLETDTVELDVTECIAQKNAEYNGYAGVWLVSNTVNTSNLDAYYISGDVTELSVKADKTAAGGILYAKKAVGDDKGLKVSGETSACLPVSPRSPPSSP